MNDAPRLSPTVPLAMPNPDSVPGALLASLDLIGPEMLRDPATLCRRLVERCPDADEAIELLMTALHDQVPQTFLEMQPVDVSSPLVARLQAELRDRHALNDDAAGWAVRTWLEVLALWFLPANARPMNTVVTGPAPSSCDRAVAPGLFGGTDDDGSIVPKIHLPDPASPSIAAAPSPATLRDEDPGMQQQCDAAFSFDMRQPEPPDARVGDRRRRRVAVAGSLAAVAIVGALVYPAFAPGAGWFTERATPQRDPTPTVVVAPTPPKAVVVALPAPPVRQSPRITDVDVPALLVAGEPATVAIRWAAEPGAIVSVERRLLAADGHPTAVDIMPTATLEQSGTDVLTLPIDTERAAAGIVEEFVLVDRDGRRSEPWRVDLAIAAPVADAQRETVATARSPQPCGDTVCGRVVRSQPIPTARIAEVNADQIASMLGIASTTSRRGEPAGYNIVVRMDDRTERAFRRSAPLAAGVRVRVDGRRLIVGGDRSKPSLH